ncbi:MAG: hypothetical protein Q4B70_04995 [Lachnospiraceae bacterium]|nr:hypothetical protein [Lachnospiraceae bacterium]
MVTMFRNVVSTDRKMNSDQKKVNSYVVSEFDKYQRILKDAGLSNVFRNNIELIFDKCKTDIVFRQADITVWLDCSKTKAANIITAMKKAGIIEPVKGFGLGRYRFIEVE